MKRKRVYTQFQVNLIVFYAMCLLFVPVVIVFSYLFDLHLYTSTNNIVLISSYITLAFFIVGLIFLLVTRDRYRRMLKPSYRREYILLLVFSGLGILGTGIFYTYLGGSFFYFPHVIIPSGIVIFTLTSFIGNKFFNVDIFKN